MPIALSRLGYKFNGFFVCYSYANQILAPHWLLKIMTSWTFGPEVPEVPSGSKNQNKPKFTKHNWNCSLLGFAKAYFQWILISFWTLLQLKKHKRFHVFPTGNFDFSCTFWIILKYTWNVHRCVCCQLCSQETVSVRLTVLKINLHSRYISYHWTVSIIKGWK